MTALFVSCEQGRHGWNALTYAVPTCFSWNINKFEKIEEHVWGCRSSFTEYYDTHFWPLQNEGCAECYICLTYLHCKLCRTVPYLIFSWPLHSTCFAVCYQDLTIALYMLCCMLLNPELYTLYCMLYVPHSVGTPLWHITEFQHMRQLFKFLPGAPFCL